MEGGSHGGREKRRWRSGGQVRERRQEGGRHAGVDGGREGSYTPGRGKIVLHNVKRRAHSFQESYEYSEVSSS